MNFSKLISWIFGIIGFAILWLICLKALPCAMSNDCLVTPLFDIFELTLFRFIVLGIIGIMLVIVALIIAQTITKIQVIPYIIDSIFLIIFILIISRYIYPTIIHALLERSLFESYRSIVFFSGLFIIIILWYLRDIIKNKFK